MLIVNRDYMYHNTENLDVTKARGEKMFSLD
jgi:hypothetical protein